MPPVEPVRRPAAPPPAPAATAFGSVRKIGTSRTQFQGFEPSSIRFQRHSISRIPISADESLKSNPRNLVAGISWVRSAAGGDPAAAGGAGAGLRWRLHSVRSKSLFSSGIRSAMGRHREGGRRSASFAATWLAGRASPPIRRLSGKSTDEFERFVRTQGTHRLEPRGFFHPSALARVRSTKAKRFSPLSAATSLAARIRSGWMYTSKAFRPSVRVDSVGTADFVAPALVVFAAFAISVVPFPVRPGF
ncbi:hypothetical protein ABIF76_003538 [Bradyrhizobium ottawaense]